MSGIVIPVEANTKSARADLEALNKKLADMIKSSKITSANLKSIKIGKTGDLGKTKKDIDSFKRSSVKANTDIAKSTNKATKSFTGLRNAVLLAGTAFAALKSVSVFHRAADDLTRLSNRLSLVSKDMKEINTNLESLYKIARDSRTDFATTTDIFVDFSKALEANNLAISKKEILEITETYQKMGAVSGSTAESLKAATVQFTQGLSSGELRGQELRSVMEQNKYFAFELQRQLNMTAGEIYKFAEAGKFSVPLLVDIFKEAKKSVDRDFGGTAYTVEQASNRMKMAFKTAVGGFNLMIDAAPNFAKFLIEIADGAERFGNAMAMQAILLKENARLAKDSLRSLSTLGQAWKAVTVGKDVFEQFAFAARVWDSVPAIWDAYFGLEALKEAFGLLKGEAEVTGFSFQKLSKNMAFGQVKIEPTFIDDIKSLGKIAAQVVTMVSILASKVANLFTVVYTPVVSLVASVFAKITHTLKKIDAAIFQTLRPSLYFIESIVDRINFLQPGKNIERAWANLFTSTSLEDFSENLGEVNTQLARGRYWDWAVTLGDIRASMISVLSVGRNFLASLGFIDNRLLSIAGFRFDRVSAGIEVLRNTITRLYQDVLAPVLEPFAHRVKNTLYLILSAIFDAVSDLFSKSLGQRMADGIFDGAAFALNSIKGFSTKDFEFTLTLDQKKVTASFKKALSSIYATLSGFVGAFSSRLYEVLNLQPLLETLSKTVEYIVALFQKVKEKAGNILPSVVSKISKFTEKVSDAFYSAYDKVVGHSYWPDLIDGVMDHSGRLDASPISAFTGLVENAFKNLPSKIDRAVTSLKDLGKNIGDSFTKFDWSSIGRGLIEGLTQIVLSIYTFSSLSGISKLGVGLSIFSMIASAIDVDLKTAEQSVTAGVAKFTGFVVDILLKEMLNGINLVISSLPSAVDAFLSAFGAPGEIFAMLVPDNKAFLAALAGLSLIAFKSKKAGKAIKKAIFGKSKDGKKVAEGFTDYFSEVFQLNGRSKIARAFRSIFASPKLAIASMAAFSLAFFDSISIFEAAALGIPLAIFAVLGKAAGAKLIREIGAKFANEFTGSFLGRLITALRVQFAVEMENIFGSAIGAIDKGSIVDKIKDIGAALFGAFRNLQNNITEYVAGNITISDALFGGYSEVRPGVYKTRGRAIKDSLRAFWAHVLDFDIKGLSLRSSYAKIKDYIASLKSLVSRGLEKIVPTSILSNLTANLEAVGSIISRYLGSILRAIRGHPLMSIAALTLIPSIFSSAEASFTGTAVSRITSSIGDLVGSLATLYAAGKALQYFGGVVRAYNRGIREIEIPVDDVIRRSREIIKEGILSGKKVLVPEARSKARAELFSKLTNEDKFRAGFDAVVEYSKEFVAKMGRTFGVVGRLGLVAYLAAANGVLTYKDALVSTYKDMKKLLVAQGLGAKSAAALAAAFSFLQTPISGPIRLFNAALAVTIASSAAVVAGFRSWAAFGELLKSLTGALVRMIGFIGIMIAAFVVSNPLTAAITAVGAFALYLFGTDEGSWISEKIGYLWDQVKGFLGLSATSRLGRQKEILEGFKGRSLGGSGFSLGEEAATVDFKALSTRDFKNLKDLSSTYQNQLDLLEKLKLEQGELTAAQLSDYKRLEAKIARLLARMPQLTDGTMQGVTDSLKGGLEAINRIDLSKSLTTLSTQFQKDIKFVPASLRNEIRGELEDLNALVDEAGSIGFKRWVAMFFGADTEIGKEVAEIDAAVAKGFADIKSRIQAASKDAFSVRIDSQFKESLKKTAKSLNKSLSIDIGAAGEKFFGSATQLKALISLERQMTKLKNSTAGTEEDLSRFNKEMEVLRLRAAAIVNNANQLSLFDNVKSQLKTLLPDLTVRQEFELLLEPDVAVLANIADITAALKTQEIGTKSGALAAKALQSRLNYLRSNLLASVPEDSWVSSLNSLLKGIKAKEIGDLAYSFADATAVNKLSKALHGLKTIRDRLASARATGRDQTASDLFIQIIDKEKLAVFAYNNVLLTSLRAANTAQSAYDLLRSQFAIDIPESIAQSQEATKKFIKLSKSAEMLKILRGTNVESNFWEIYSKALNSVTTQLEDMQETAEDLNLADFKSQLSDLGFDLDTTQLSQLSQTQLDNVKEILSGVTQEEDIEFISGSIKTALEARNVATRQLADTLGAVMHSSNEGLQSLLTLIDVDMEEHAAQLKGDVLASLIAIGAQVRRLQREKTFLADPEKILEITTRIGKLKADASGIVAIFASMDQNINSINEAFKVDLGKEMFSYMSQDMRTKLLADALDFNKRMQEAVKGKDPESLRALLEEQMKKSLNLQIDFETSGLNAAVESAKVKLSAPADQIAFILEQMPALSDFRADIEKLSGKSFIKAVDDALRIAGAKRAQALGKQTQDEVDATSSSLEGQIVQSFNRVGAKMRHSLVAIGVALQEGAENLIDPEEWKRIQEPLKAVIEAKNILRNVTGHEEKALAAEAYQRKLDALNEAVKEATEADLVQTLKYSENLQTAISSGLKSNVKGLMQDFSSVADLFESVLDTFTNAIIDSFTNILIDKLMAKIVKGPMEQLVGSFMKFLGAALPFANGGFVSGPGTGTSDSIPAALSDGEFVVNARATRENLELLHSINSGRMNRFATGGFVTPNRRSKTLAPVNGKGVVKQEINFNVTGDVSRQTRKEVIKMLPTIAAGLQRA